MCDRRRHHKEKAGRQPGLFVVNKTPRKRQCPAKVSARKLVDPPELLLIRGLLRKDHSEASDGACGRFVASSDSHCLTGLFSILCQFLIIRGRKDPELTNLTTSSGRTGSNTERIPISLSSSRPGSPPVDRIPDSVSKAILFDLGHEKTEETCLRICC